MDHFCLRLSKVFVNFDKLFRTFGQAEESVLGKFALIQIGLGNFAFVRILEETLHGSQCYL